jgi:nitrogen fixation/metabolism regulation signal transduction histidine kinase
LKTVRIRPKHFFINVRGLLLIYIVLCIVVILFSRFFINEILQEGNTPGLLNLVIFFAIPVVLMVFLAVSAFGLFQDLLARRTGSKFQARLLAYFLLSVFLAAAPVTIITLQSVNELIRFWKSMDIDTAMQEAQKFSLENYALHLEKMEAMVNRTDFEGFMVLYAVYEEEIPQAGGTGAGEGAPAARLPEGIAALEDFTLIDGYWKKLRYAGDAGFRLETLPLSVQAGFMRREMPRDTDTIRYVTFPEPNLARVISYNLGTGFDKANQIIESEKARFEVISSLQIKIGTILFIYYGIFFLPILFMTVIITVSFSRRITVPIIEIAEATKKVAEGDFSIQILAHRGDELGILIRSFNTMVKELDKSRSALIETEKISVWQSIAQQLAHEIKNPLTPIRLSAERVMRRWTNEPERIGEILKDSMLAIIQEVEGLSTLLTEFRTLSRPMEPSQSRIILREIIKETIAPYRASYPQVEFKIEHVESGISIKIDKHRMAQVLTNLIINGIDAMKEKGTIEIRTDLVKKRESRYIRISIRDTGAGISKKNGKHIWTPYFTTKTSGTGLGLPIVERILNDHGGSIYFNSEEGIGTTFFIDLPLEEKNR